MTMPAFLVLGEDDLSKGNLDQIPQRLVKMTNAGTIKKKLLKKFTIGDILTPSVGGVNRPNSKNI